jgi:hypothetical protein
MSSVHNPIHFGPAPFLRVTPNAFVYDHLELDSFPATIQAMSLLRKRFSNGRLVCFSPDGSSAKDGSPCPSCPHRPSCLPRIRLRLGPSSHHLPTPIFLELSFSSAKNYLNFFSFLLAHNLDPALTPCRISLTNRGQWAEVSFALLNPPPDLPR